MPSSPIDLDVPFWFEACAQNIIANYDGKDYKYTGSPDYDTIALKRVDANTNEATLKKDGKVVQTAKVVLSGGGKVRTITLTGTTATGRKVSNVMVFDKQ